MNDGALRWVEKRLGSPVTGVRPLSGGITSTMLALSTAGRDDVVLRLMTNEPWRTHGAELTTREHQTQVMLAATAIPAPRSLALDASGAEAGDPAHLMTRLPGGIDTGRVSGSELETVARLLAAIHELGHELGHELHPVPRPRTYQSWAAPAKHVVPDWAQHPEAWQRAFAILEQDPPPYDGVFLHRDFAPRNLLWTASEITGVVDWVETSWGPAWLDVAHFRTMLAVGHGTEVADRFGATYVRLTGREPQPYFDVMDVVGLLPSPGRPSFITDAAQRARLESHLLSLM